MSSNFPSTAESVARNEWIAASALSLIALIALMAATPRLTTSDPRFAEPADHHKYIYMAEHGPARFHIAPFCWRIGVPELARWLPGKLALGFLSIACIGIAAAGVGVYAAARAFGQDHSIGLFAILLFFAMGWAARFALFDFWLPDGLLMALVVWTIVCAKRGRPLAFVVLTSLGVLVKESALFAAPLYATLAPPAQKGAVITARRLALGLPAVLVWLSIRTAIPALNADESYVASLSANLRTADDVAHSYDYFQRARIITSRRLHDLGAPALHACTTEAFGMAPCLLSLLAIRRNLALLGRLWPFVVMVYAQLIFATDTQRLIVLAFPAALLMSGNGVDALTRRLGIPTIAWLPLGAILFSETIWNPQRRIAGTIPQLVAIFAYAALVLILRKQKMRN